MKIRKNEKTITPTEFNTLVEELEAYNIKHEISNFSTCVKLETANTIYDVSLTGKKEDIINMGTIASAFYKKSNIHDLRGQYGYREYYNELGKKKVEWDYSIASGYQYTDDYYVLKPLKCWGYDINSAFPFAMLSPMPDTRKEPRYNDAIKKGEIGFYKLGGVTTEEGDIADIIFPLMDSPFKSYVLENYNGKKNTTGAEKDNYKKKLNFVTGFIAKRNIFLRNALVHYSNKYIKSFIDENTVYCNVDCIVSITPRYDLPVGSEIGMFKEEHTCEYFKYKRSGIYQWSKDCHYVGIPQGILTDIEDIEHWTDKLPYKFENRRIIANEKAKNIKRK